MGPRFCKRGNRQVKSVGILDVERLQWGHAFVSVETSLFLLSVLSDSARFNGATLL